MPKITATDITTPNINWGICGFASSITAAFENRKLTKSIEMGHFSTRLLAEIKTYLNMLKSVNSPLIQDIQGLTRTFKGFENFSIDRFLQQIDDAVDSPIQGNFGLAMPEKAVVDYLCRMHSLRARLEKADNNRTNVIFGLYRVTGFIFHTKQLRHWVYCRSDGNVYNYGKLTTLNEALNPASGSLKVGCVIAF